jgi:hypothetical protein
MSVPADKMSVWAPPTETAIALAAWFIKDGIHDSAIAYVPAFIIDKSYHNPIAIASFYSSHHTTDFIGLYGQGYRSSKVNMTALAMVFILRNGKVVYYKNASVMVNYNKTIKRTEALKKITYSLFD